MEHGIPGTAPAGPVATDEWRRLDPRTLLVHCGWLAAPLGSLALTALATGGRITTGAWITLAAIAASFAVVTTLGLIRWARTEFRITLPRRPDGTGAGAPGGGHGPASPTLEVRSGLLTRRLRSVPLQRIRTVDLTAPLPHRLLGVTVLRAGTAGSGTAAANCRWRPSRSRRRSGCAPSCSRTRTPSRSRTIRWWPVSAGAGCGTHR